jgi:DNA-binding response OmpR family regulator
VTGFDFQWVVAEDDENDFLLVKRCCARLCPAPRLIRARDELEAESYLRGLARDDTAATRSSLPSLSLSDVNMPKESGLEFLGWAKQQGYLSNIPFLLLTSCCKPEDKLQAEQLGADDYLIKPASLDELFEVLRDVLDHWCIHRQQTLAEHGAPKGLVTENKLLSRQLRRQAAHLPLNMPFGAVFSLLLKELKLDSE